MKGRKIIAEFLHIEDRFSWYLVALLSRYAILDSPKVFESYRWALMTKLEVSVIEGRQSQGLSIAGQPREYAKIFRQSCDHFYQPSPNNYPLRKQEIEYKLKLRWLRREEEWSRDRTKADDVWGRIQTRPVNLVRCTASSKSLEPFHEPSLMRLSIEHKIEAGTFQIGNFPINIRSLCSSHLIQTIVWLTDDTKCGINANLDDSKEESNCREQMWLSKGYSR